MKVSKESKFYLKKYREALIIHNVYSLKVSDFNKRMKDVNKEDMTELELMESRELWDEYNNLMITYIYMKKLRGKLIKGKRLKSKKKK